MSCGMSWATCTFFRASTSRPCTPIRRSIQLDESFGRPYSNLALTYVQQGKYDQAIDLYRQKH